MTQTAFGQTDAVAQELATALNNYSPAFVLPVSAQKLWFPKLDIADIPKIGESVRLQVIPGDDLSDRDALDGVYDDLLGVHIVMLQQVTDTAGSGGISEDQVGLLMQLRAEIIELLCSKRLDCPTAVHPFSNAHVYAVRHGKEGAYDLNRLAGEAGLFYSDNIFTYRAAGLRRRT